MAESTLSLGHPDIAKAIGRYMGYGGDSAEWEVDEIDEINEIIKSGLRQFYHPPLVPGTNKAHEWRFMKPVTTLVTVAADYDYDLPDNFGFIIGNLTYPVGSSLLSPPLRVVGEGDIRNVRQASDVSGRPTFAAIRPKVSTGLTGQRYELLLYPTPDGVYTLTYQYSVLPEAITTLAPYPLGGMAHAETILQSCIAIAEQRKENEKDIEWQTFMERLMASISHDKNQSPAFYGYNGDASGGRGDASRTLAVTYKGVQY